MALRKAKDSDFLGKQIATIDAESVNVLELTFTDGTQIKLWAELAVFTEAGTIPGIFVDSD